MTFLALNTDLQFPFVTVLMNGDWINRGSSGPGETTFLLHGNSTSDAKASGAEKISLTLQLQEKFATINYHLIALRPLCRASMPASQTTLSYVQL